MIVVDFALIYHSVGVKLSLAGVLRYVADLGIYDFIVLVHDKWVCAMREKIRAT